MMARSTSCGGLSLTFLVIHALLFMSTDGATQDAEQISSDGLQRKSFAVYGHHEHHREARGPPEPRGGKIRMPRQAGEQSMAYSPDEIQTLLTAHLEYRRNVTPPAADMNIIAWDAELATLARDWAGRCNFEHGFPSAPQAYGGLVAQNLWMGSKSYELKAAVTAWYNEYLDYDYATEACSAECGHYRIMVYSGVETIGCGSASCENGRERLTVCNYGPSVGSKGVPYKAGPPCGLCASGKGWCDNKLCRADCEGESSQCSCDLKCQNCAELDESGCTCNCKAGWRGTDCSEPCADYKSYCSSGAYTPRTCQTDPGAQKDCPATCELCDGLKDTTPTEDKCCDGKTCDAGSVLDEATCNCVDYLEATKTGPGSGAAPLTVGWTCIVAFTVLTSLRGALIGYV